MDRSGSPPRLTPRARAAAATDGAAGDPAPAVLAALAALAAARALAALAPGTWAWSLDGLRYVAPAVGWPIWVISALALLPPLAARLAPAIVAAGSALERHPAWRLVPALAIGGTIGLLPDRTWLTGDFLLRAGAVDSAREFARIAPQSLPLDTGIHIALPRLLAASGWIPRPGEAAPWIGAVEVGTLVFLLLAVAGEWVEGAAARALFAATVLGSAALGLFAGYGKSAGEMVLLTVATGWLAARFAREGRGAAALGLVMAGALATHRSALLLLPGWAAAWWVAWRARRAPRAPAGRAIGLGLPLAVLAALSPRLVGLLLSFDLGRHVLAPGAGGVPWWRATLDPLGLLDRINIALVYAPLAPLAIALAVGRRRAAPGGARADRWVTWSLAVPAAAMALLVRPQQGLFRDWDVFVVPGTLLAIATAAGVARAASARPSRLAAPLLACALAGAGLALASGNDPARGLDRARAFALEPPRRSDAERGKLWEFVGDRAASLGRWDEAAPALENAVRTQPSPRLYSMLAMAEEARGHLEGAERAWQLAVERDPADTTAWVRLISSALARGDVARARAAAESLRLRSPAHPLVRRVLPEP